MEKSYLPTPKKSTKVKQESLTKTKQLQSPQKDKTKPSQCVSYSHQPEQQIATNKASIISSERSHDITASGAVGGDSVINRSSNDVTGVSDVTVKGKRASVSRVTKLRLCNLYSVNDTAETNRHDRAVVDRKTEEVVDEVGLRDVGLNETLNSSPSLDSSLSDDESSLVRKKLLWFEQRNKQLRRRADEVPKSLKFCHDFKDVEVPSSWTQFVPRKSKSIDRIECGNVIDKCAYYPLDHDSENDLDNDPDISPIYHELDPIDVRHSSIHTYQSITELKEDLRALQANSEAKNSSNPSDIHLRQTTVELLSKPDETAQPAATAVCLLPEKEHSQKSGRHFFFSKLRLPKRNASSHKQPDNRKGSGETEKSKMPITLVLSQSTKNSASPLGEGSALSPTEFHTQSPITVSGAFVNSQSKVQNYDVCIPTSSSAYYAHIKKQACDGISLQQSPRKVHLSTFAKAPYHSNDRGKSLDLPFNESFVLESKNPVSRTFQKSVNCSTSDIDLDTPCPPMLLDNLLQMNSSRRQNISQANSASLTKRQTSKNVKSPTHERNSFEERGASFDADNIPDNHSSAKEGKTFMLVSDNKSYSKKPEYLPYSLNPTKKLASPIKSTNMRKSQCGGEIKYENSQARQQQDLHRSTKKHSLVKALSFESDLSSRRDSSEHINAQWSGERRLMFASPSCGIRMAEIRAERRTSENKSPSPELKISTPPPSCLPRFFTSTQSSGLSAKKHKKDASSQTFAKPTSRPVGVSSSRTKMNTIVEEEHSSTVDGQTNKIDGNNINDKALVTSDNKLLENYDLIGCNETSAETIEQTTQSVRITVSSIVTDLLVPSIAAQADLRAVVDIPVSVAENLCLLLDTSPTAVIDENVNKPSSVVPNRSVENDLLCDNLSRESSSQTPTNAPNASSFATTSISPKCELIVRRKLNTTHLDYSEINFDSMNSVTSERNEAVTSLEDSVRDVVQKGSSSSSRLKPPKPAKCMTSSMAVPSPDYHGDTPQSPSAREAHSSRLKNVSDQHRHPLRDVKTGVNEPPSPHVVLNQFCPTASSSIINDANTAAALTKPQTIIKRASVRNIDSSGSVNIPTATRDSEGGNKNLNSNEIVVTSSLIHTSSNLSSTAAVAVGCSRWSLRPAQMLHSVATSATTTATTATTATTTSGGSNFHNVPPVVATSRCITDKKQLRLKSVSSPQTSPQRRRCTSSSRNCSTEASPVPDGPHEIDSDCPQKTAGAICSITSSIRPRSSIVRISPQPPPPTPPPPHNDRSLSFSSSSTGSSTGSVVSAADSESEQCVFSYKKRLAVFERRDCALPTFRLNLISSDRENKTSASQLLTNRVLNQCSVNDYKSFKYQSGRPVRANLLNSAPDRQGFESLRLNETDESSSRPSSGKSYSEDDRSDYASSTGN